MYPTLILRLMFHPRHSRVAAAKAVETSHVLCSLCAGAEGCDPACNSRSGALYKAQPPSVVPYPCQMTLR